MNPLAHPGLAIAYATIDAHRAQLVDAGVADMALAARYAGRHYDTFRKAQGGWRDLVRDEGFPAPYRERPYLWRLASLHAWQERKEREAGERLRGLDPKPANDTRRDGPAGARVNHQRRKLMERMG